jgi:hypothetical protein
MSHGFRASSCGGLAVGGKGERLTTRSSKATGQEKLFATPPFDEKRLREIGASRVRRASRKLERPNDPTAVDLSMRGAAIYNEGLAPDNLNRAIGYFERALALDPQLPQALIGRSLAQMSSVPSNGP